MANENITLKRNNAGTYDNLYPRTTWTQVQDKPTTFTPTAHTHVATDITSGTIATARLGSGTANSGVFLRGDQTYSNSIANNFLPSTDSTYTLGNASIAWSEVFTDALTLNDELTIGSQVFYSQGTNGFSVNEDYDPSNTSTQTAYHFTSGSGRSELAFTLARTASFTNGFGIYGNSLDNKFVSFGEQSNTSWEWRTGVGIQPLDLDGGTLRLSLSSGGTLNLPNHNGSTTGLSLGGTVVTATGAELNYVDGVTSNIQSQLDSKATPSDITTAINNLVDTAPGTLNTLNELAAALGDDPNFATTVTNSIATKLPLAGGTMTGSISFGDSNQDIDLSRGSHITFYEDTSINHSIGSRDNLGNEADDLRINTYGSLYINLDSNNNNTTDADFMIGNHGGTGTINELFRVSGETGNVTLAGTVDGVDIAALDTSVVKLSGTQTITGYKTLNAGMGIGNSSGTTSDGITFNTAQAYTGPQIRGKVQTLYRDYYLSSYEIADAGNYASVIPGSLTELYTAGPTLVTASTATWTDFALGYTPAVGDKFLVIVSVGSNSTAIEKAGVIVEYGTFSSTNGMSLVGFMGYGGVSGTNVIGVNYGAQWQISSTNFRLRYPASSAWNSTTLTAVTTFYVWKIYRIN